MQFSQYFYDWLYAKEGYYSHYSHIGKSGDFYTAVSVSKFFGGSIAKKIIETIHAGELPKDTTILEIGAHHGYLLADIIEFINTLAPELLDTLNFAIVERYEHLRQKQKEYFEESFGDVIDLKHFNDIKEVRLNSAYVVANEIFDAFPCELVYEKEDEKQLVVVNDHQLEFIKNEQKELLERCKKYEITKGELAIGYDEFAQTMCDNIATFHFMSFDYGDIYPRNDFSTRIYAKHQVFPLFEEGLKLEDYFAQSDITYDVHFGYLIDCFEKAGAQKLSYETQLKALVEFGIIDLLEMVQKHASEKEYLHEVQKVKTLLEPIGMGERFKMVLFKK
ncbi:MAG: SAM-dependent methyltransferase [Campylobacterota bacterium]|nr:SAM-dependent methyltransferase [Campylobacterota bacterium]